VRHELNVTKSLNTISNYCPYFCKTIGSISCNVDMPVPEQNPFIPTSTYPFETEVLLSEYLEDSCKFYNYIRSSKISDNVIFGIVKQIFAALMISQKECKFTHYDLHSYNIMMKKCDENIVFLYKIDENTTFLVPSYGHYPKIIDFGFSYSKSLEDDYLYQTMDHTDVGFTTDRFDWLSDAKLFLITSSSEIKNHRLNEMSKKLREITHDIFDDMELDWDSGWDAFEKNGIATYVSDIFEKNCGSSKFFKKYSFRCIDIIQSLIILPMEEQDYDNPRISFESFITEFVKIEKEIQCPFKLVFVLKRIVDVARNIYFRYITKREETVLYFTQSVYNIIDSITKFCKPKKPIYFEKMLCSLYSLQKCIEGYFYKKIVKHKARKQKEYDKTTIKSIKEIYEMIEESIPTDYTFNSSTSVFVFDVPNKNCTTLALNTEQIKYINKLSFKDKVEFLKKL